MGLDDVVCHLVDVRTQTSESRAAGREVTGAVPRDRREPRLVHRRPSLDLGPDSIEKIWLEFWLDK